METNGIFKRNTNKVSLIFILFFFFRFHITHISFVSNISTRLETLIHTSWFVRASSWSKSMREFHRRTYDFSYRVADYFLRQIDSFLSFLQSGKENFILISIIRELSFNLINLRLQFPH